MFPLLIILVVPCRCLNTKGQIHVCFQSGLDFVPVENTFTQCKGTYFVYALIFLIYFY